MKEKFRDFWNKTLKTGHMPLYLATVLVTAGVYFTFPEMGFSATLSLMLLLGALSFWVFPKLWFSPVASLAISLFYGVTASLPDPVSFGFFSFLITLCGALFAKSLVRGIKEKKILSFVFAIVFFSAGLGCNVFYLGTPAAYLAAESKAETYLNENYPDQEFFDVRVHYEYRKKGYRTTVSYDYLGNALTSEMFFGEKETEDGYFVAYTDFITEKRKSQFISLFQKNGYSLITEIAPFPKEEVASPYPGSYGDLNEDWLKKMQFSVTFREEKPDRSDFADACSEVLSKLQEEGMAFGKITFYGLDAGRPVLRCEVKYDTDPKETLSLVTANS